MPETLSYDPENIFARILRGEIPAIKVHETEHALAILDIMPRTPGHALVMPKAPARNLLDVPPEALAQVILLAQRIANACKTALNADGITVQQFSESAAGQEVFHLHFHILPRFAGQKIASYPAPQADKAELAATAEKIRAILARDGAG